MREYISELMPLIVEALLDGAAVTKREVAVATLGHVVQSTGYVIAPYNEYPQLLGLLLKLLNGELVWSTRREVLKVLGIMGALDPHAHKKNQQAFLGHMEMLPVLPVIQVNIFHLQWMNYPWTFGHHLLHLKITTPLLLSILSCEFLGILLLPVTTKRWLDLSCLFSSQWFWVVFHTCQRFCMISFRLFVHVMII